MKVDVVIRDAEVIDGFGFAGVEQALRGDPLQIVAQQAVAGFQQARLHPSFIVREKRMLARRADDLPADMQMPNPSRSAEDLRDVIDFEFAVG